MRKSLPWSLLATLCLVPNSQAAEVPVADLTASVLESTGLDDIAGHARALTYRSHQDTDPTDFTLQLTAAHLHVESDRAQSALNAFGAEVDGTAWTNASDYDHATLTLESARPHFKVEALARPGHDFSASSSSSCLILQPPKQANVEVTKFAQSSRPAPSVSTDGALQATPCHGLIQAQGDFLLALWEVTVRVESGGTKTRHHSGEGSGDLRSPDGSTAPFSAHQSDQLFITVTGGDLRLQRTTETGPRPSLFLLDPVAHVQGRIEASDAHGRLLAGTGETLPSHLRLEGDFQVQASRAGNALQAHVTAPGPITLNGIQIGPKSTAISPVSAQPWWTLVIGILGVAIVAAANMAYRPPLAATMAFLPLLFGDEDIINEAGLDRRGRRLLRRLENYGLATLHRIDVTDEQGNPHVVYSYHLHPAARSPPGPIRRAANEFAALYDQLPETAWRHGPAPTAKKTMDAARESSTQRHTPA